MERAKGGKHPSDKANKARIAEHAIDDMGVTIGVNRDYRRADIVAEHPEKGLFIVEVEGDSSKQKEQAMYSALGQLLLMMDGKKHTFILAVPDDEKWETVIQRIPAYSLTALNLSCVLVREKGVRKPSVQQPSKPNKPR
jgi:hypothetical protein